jgi:hypothetical protein
MSWNTGLLLNNLYASVKNAVANPATTNLSLNGYNITSVGTLTASSVNCTGTVTASSVSCTGTVTAQTISCSGTATSSVVATTQVQCSGIIYGNPIQLAPAVTGYPTSYQNLGVNNFNFYASSNLFNLSTGTQNIVVGQNLSGSSNSALTTGSNNIIIGSQTATNLTTGSVNVYVGAGATNSSATVQNEVVLGSSQTGKGSNTVTLGNSSTTGLYCNVTSISGFSDERIKDNIQELDAIPLIMKLRPVEFDFKTGDKRHDVGFIAQEFEKVFPQFVSEIVPDEEQKQFVESNIKTMQMNKLEPYLVQAIQDLQRQVYELRQKLGEDILIV